MLSSQEFNKIINNQFTNLVTGQDINTIGGFASLDLEKTKVKFAPNHIFESGKIIALDMNGGITDGVFGIINNSELNTNISLGLQIHLIDKTKKRKLVFDSDQYKELENKTSELKENYSKDSLSIVKKSELTMLRFDSIKLKSENENLQKKKIIYEQFFKKDSSLLNKMRLDSLAFEISLLQLKSKDE